MIAVGEKAPSFSFTNQDGDSVELSDFSNKFVLMWWYPRADTPGWTIEGNGFRDRIQEFTAKNCSIVGVSFGSNADNKAFKDKANYPFDLLSDSDHKASNAFGVVTSDTGRSNRVSVLIGPDGLISKSYSQVDVAKHPEQVLADLSNLA